MKPLPLFFMPASAYRSQRHSQTTAPFRLCVLNLEKLKEKPELSTADVAIESSEDFILFMLGTIRGTEKSAPYTVRFAEGYETSGGCRLPKVWFGRKEKREKNG